MSGFSREWYSGGKSPRNPRYVAIAAVAVAALLVSLIALGSLFVFPGPQGPPGPQGQVPAGLNATLASLNLSVSVLASRLASQQTQPASPNGGPNSLTLVEIMETRWNSSVAQPMFFVLGSHGLQSAANITVSANTTLQLVIFSYDSPTPNSTAGEAAVKGTIGNIVYVINGTLAAGTANATTAEMEEWGENVSSVPVGSLAHTFTIMQLGVNIPVVAGSVVITDVHFDKPGTYAWVCLTPCGFGANGMEGAMASQGWMVGSVVVK